jgi:hypothetical protein
MAERMVAWHPVGKCWPVWSTIGRRDNVAPGTDIGEIWEGAADMERRIWEGEANLGKYGRERQDMGIKGQELDREPVCRAYILR